MGDWQWTDINRVLTISVSHLPDQRYEWLVAIHELVESLLCRLHGVTEESVDAFDIEYEKNRKDGDVSEPGNDPSSPYFKDHRAASLIEELCARFMDVNWATYDKAVSEL